MKNTYVKCADWSWEDKLLYIKACIGDDMPHEKFCGNASYNKACLLERYSRVAAYIYCYSSGMISFDVKSDGLNLSSASKREVKLSELKPKPTKFVKVEESIFDLKEEFEKGELYAVNGREKHFVINNEGWLTNAKSNGNVYRQVEIDWHESVRGFLSRPEIDGKFSIDKNCISINCTFNEGELVEFCHFVAELTDKPE